MSKKFSPEELQSIEDSMHVVESVFGPLGRELTDAEREQCLELKRMLKGTGSTATQQNTHEQT